MTRFNELNRIKTAIKTRDASELAWAESYAKMRVNTAYQIHPNKIAKQAQKKWSKILEDIQNTLAELACTDTDLYDAWIISLFNHAQKDGDWRFDDDRKPIEIPEKLLPDYLIKLNSDLPRIIKRYSDWQLGKGFSYIYSPTISNLCFSIRDGAAPIQNRVDAIKSMKNMYKDCFEVRCHPVLGHLGEESSELDSFCYILWDVTALSWCSEDHPNREEIYAAVSDVMEYALTLKNLSCIESALHGLGHLVDFWPQAENIVEDFIRRSKNIDPRILSYAEKAKNGDVL